MINDWLATWARLSARAKLIAAGSAGAIVLGALVLIFASAIGRGCSSREDVTARVGVVSSGLQQAAAQGKIAVKRLAEGIKRINAAATAYESTQDHQAYCDALDAVSDEYKLAE